MRTLARAAVFCLFVIGAAHPVWSADDASPLFRKGDCAQAAASTAEEMPPFVWLGSCQAQEFCPATCVFLTCSGTTCSSGTGFVICDGVRHNCPSCNPPAGCADPTVYCECRQGCGGLAACVSEYC